MQSLKLATFIEKMKLSEKCASGGPGYERVVFHMNSKLDISRAVLTGQWLVGP